MGDVTKIIFFEQDKQAFPASGYIQESLKAIQEPVYEKTDYYGIWHTGH